MFNDCFAYATKQYDGEAVALDYWGLWDTIRPLTIWWWACHHWKGYISSLFAINDVIKSRILHGDSFNIRLLIIKNLPLFLISNYYCPISPNTSTRQPHHQIVKWHIQRNHLKSYLSFVLAINDVPHSPNSEVTDSPFDWNIKMVTSLLY